MGSNPTLVSKEYSKVSGVVTHPAVNRTPKGNRRFDPYPWSQNSGGGREVMQLIVYQHDTGSSPVHRARVGRSVVVSTVGCDPASMGSNPIGHPNNVTRRSE